MKIIVVALAIVGVVSGSALYDAVKSMTNYGQGYKDNCYDTYETKYKEQCEDYEEKVCYTIQREHCDDVLGKKCRAIQTYQQERACFDVQEMICSLREGVQYEEVPAISTVQRCHNVPERVCDTVYEAEFTDKDDFKCISVVNPKCSMIERTVYDQTCRHVTNFDCKADAYGSGYATVGAKMEYGQKSYGDSREQRESGGRMESGPGQMESAQMEFGSGQMESSQKPYGDYREDYGSSKEDSYGSNYKCARSYDVKCYNTPRVVTSEHCEDVEQEVCEKLTERIPVPREQQSCHDEMKKVCELEEKSQPRQVRKYVYTKDCRPVNKHICENADQKYLMPSCVPYSRKECTYQPEEKCDRIPKKHCYKVPYQVKKRECPAQGYEQPEY